MSEKTITKSPLGTFDSPEVGADAGAGGPGARSGAVRSRRPFMARRKVCRFCAENIESVDFKQIQILRTFTTDRGKIIPGRISGNCAGHQRQLTQAVKRARYLALLPFAQV